MAAPLPATAADELWQALAPLRGRHSEARWLAPEKLHLTLVFLGPTDAMRVDALSSAIGRVSVGHAPFEARSGVAGGRIHDRRGGVAWLRLERGAAQVAALALDLDSAMGSLTYDERRPPHPHLTVARGVDEETLADLRSAASEIDFTWTVDRTVLMRSHTDPTSSRYEQLAAWPLTGAPGRP